MLRLEDAHGECAAFEPGAMFPAGLPSRHWSLAVHADETNGPRALTYIPFVKIVPLDKGARR